MNNYFGSGDSAVFRVSVGFYYIVNMKLYNSEKAIISLTSWKARIDTVGLTIFSLVKQCPGFHIVLTLSEDEFPAKEAELPDTIMAFVDNDMIEILWVKRNFKAYKKFLFTAQKYKGIPIISADDDCLYTCNYAETLYKKWLETKIPVIRYTERNEKITQGPCTLYCLSPTLVQKFLNTLTDREIEKSRDDIVFSFFLERYGVDMECAVGKNKFPFVFHDDVQPLTKGQRGMRCYAQCFG